MSLKPGRREQKSLKMRQMSMKLGHLTHFCKKLQKKFAVSKTVAIFAVY